MTPDEINLAVALRVAKLVRCEQWGPAAHPLMGVMKTDCGHENCHPAQFWPPDYLKQPNAVLELLERYNWNLKMRFKDGEKNYFVEIANDACYASGPTFCHAACLALLTTIPA